MSMQAHSKKRVCYYYDSKYSFKKIKIFWSILPSEFFICLDLLIFDGISTGFLSQRHCQFYSSDVDNNYSVISQNISIV